MSSLDWAALRDLRRYEPALRVGLCTRRIATGSGPADVRAAARRRPRRDEVDASPPIGRWLGRVEASAAVVHRQLVTPSLIRVCHHRGAAVWAWTVNDPAEAETLVEWGADAIITDDPRILGPSNHSTR